MDYLSVLAQRMAEAKSGALSGGTTKAERQTKSLLQSYDTSDLWDVKWIGEETQRILFEAWISTQAELKTLWLKGIEKIKLPFFAKRGINSFLKGETNIIDNKQK